MFKNLRTGTKLIILCSTFIVAIGVTLYALVVEKQIALDFARKELVGNRYLAAVRETYAAILAHTRGSGDQQARLIDGAVNALAAAGAAADRILETAELREALAAKLRALRARKPGEERADPAVRDALAAGHKLASRIGDDSDLALDPDLDSYHLQNIIVTRLPTLLGQLGDMQQAFHAPAATPTVANERVMQFRILDGLVRSTLEEMTGGLAAAYRGNPDGHLRPSLEAEFAAMGSQAESYLRALNASLAGGAAPDPSLDRLYATTVESAITAWTSAQGALDRLLQRRIDGLRERMALGLGLTGALAGLSILIAVMTHRHIVQPLERLEHIATTVRESKNYNLRIDYSSGDEIGRLASAFDDMLSELAAARERELSKQAEFARTTRLTTMGQMAASIAHEINQPLAAIVTGSSAGLRWLGRATPDLDEVRAALQRINNDGHRASQVIASVRAMFKKEGQERAAVSINDLIREVLVLAGGDLRTRKISVQTELAEPLPPVLADQVQLQQVLLNLITNAADAMAPVTGRARVLQIRSSVDGSEGIMVVVQDSGIGIDADARERMFDAFFTTKSHGMGLGLSICRSIVEAHGGRLWASPGTPHGSLLQLVLPGDNPGGAA